jgi:prephenate dehydratase
VRVAYLGPAGTFSEDALGASGFCPPGFEPVLCDTIADVIESIGRGHADRAFVPVENSIEGSVRSTLDTLVSEADSVTIAGEYVHEIRSALIAATDLTLDRISAVISHPQPLAQCARFIREELPGAEVRVADSTSAAVRQVGEGEPGLAALGPATAAAIYGCRVIREGIEDEPGNLTRFLWLAPSGGPDDIEDTDHGSGDPDVLWKTTVVFSGLGNDHPGALVDALLEFSTRQINLARIESRPERRELGRYRFFIDIEGRDTDPGVSGALEGLRSKASSVRVLGSYATSSDASAAGSSS